MRTYVIACVIRIERCDAMLRLHISNPYNVNLETFEWRYSRLSMSFYHAMLDICIRYIS